MPARLVLLLLGLCTAACHAKDDPHHCEPSSCGDIHNISYPFRLNDDPKKCGAQRYTLSCENNLTVLHLYSGKYYVLAINYGNATIRVVDANIRKGNCSSIPRNSLASYNFSDEDPYSTYNFRDEVSFELSKPIIFMTCETRPVNSYLYMDTSPCINATSGHSFVITGGLSVSDLWDSCRIELMVLTSSSIGTKDMNSSYIDIHNELLYGFELAWFQIYSRSGAGYYSNLIFAYLSFLLPGLFPMAVWTATKAIFGIPCVLVFLILKLKRRHLSMYSVIEEFLQSHNNLMPIRYSYSNIKKMTKGFKDKLGEGGYGAVYKGKLRSGHLVAVKLLGNSKANGQDFMNEVATIGRIHHVNVVRLIGYCAEGSKRALIYEYMSKGSLDKHIFPKEGLISLSCKEAFEISLGVARGIDYLHQGCDMKILHFDIKPHNILLDEKFVPKISDFGLARLCPLDDNSLTLTAARGTIGYIAPELFYKRCVKQS
ncbi:hypothetical protein ABKV19_026249 [Rosa sericea]